MRFWQRWRLRTQIRAVALATLAFGVLGTFVLASYYEGKLYGRELEWRARVMARALEASAIEPLLNYDIVKLDNLVESMRGEGGEVPDKDLAYAMILDSDGRVLADSHGYRDYGQPFDDPASAAAQADGGEELVQRIAKSDVLEVSRPVMIGGKRWGTVRVGLSLTHFYGEVRGARWRTLGVVLLMAALLALLTSATLRPLFLRPLDEVMKAARAIGERHFEHRIEHQRKDELGALYDAMNRTAVLLEHSETMHAVFGQYVTNAVRDAILSGAVSPFGSEVKAAILFADLRGFTRRSERMAPDEVLLLLNRFCSRMTAAVEAHGGIVDKFIGDSIMAVFGAPLPQSDAALRAANAAQTMRAELAELNAELAEERQEPLQMGIGIHLGQCVAGSVGAPTRMQYTVVGDTVNVAARLEELTKEKGVGVIVSDELVRACGAAVETRDLGEAAVRGRKTGVHVYELVRVEVPLEEARRAGGAA